jgi:4'-phosphopantetheinyl transferase
MLIKSWTIDGRVQLELHREPPADAENKWLQHVPTHERARAEKMQSATRAHSFLFARSCMRQMLGKLLAIAPVDVPIALTDSGKPYLASPPTPVAFSLSHSHGMLQLGATAGKGALGVDLQYMDPATDIEAIAKRFFTDTENQQLAAVSAHERRQHAFALWCEKEARFKAGAAGTMMKTEKLDENYFYALCFS